MATVTITTCFKSTTTAFSIGSPRGFNQEVGNFIAELGKLVEQYGKPTYIAEDFSIRQTLQVCVEKLPEVLQLITKCAVEKKIEISEIKMKSTPPVSNSPANNIMGWLSGSNPPNNNGGLFGNGASNNNGGFSFGNGSPANKGLFAHDAAFSVFYGGQKLYPSTQ